MGRHPLLYARVLAVAGGATAIVLAIGLETANRHGVARLAAGIVLVTALGEAACRRVLRAERTP